MLLITNPVRSNSLRIASFYRLNKSGVKTHPYLTLLSVCISTELVFYPYAGGHFKVVE